VDEQAAGEGEQPKEEEPQREDKVQAKIGVRHAGGKETVFPFPTVSPGCPIRLGALTLPEHSVTRVQVHQSRARQQKLFSP
jgi:hypothetical protein